MDATTAAPEDARPLEQLAALALAEPPPPPSEAIRALDELFAERGDDDPIGGVEVPPDPPSEHLDVPSRAETAAAIARVTPSVRACAADQAGTVVELRFVFASTGRVTTAHVESRSTRLTPQQRSCIARAARRAEVASFARPRFEVTYAIRF